MGNAFTVRSSNFSFHAVLTLGCYAEALAAAKARGFEAHINFGSTLVATWSPLYGVKVYDRVLAGSPPGLIPTSCSPVGSCGCCMACTTVKS